MEQMIGILFPFLIIGLLLMLGLVIGGANERSHFAAIRQREAQLSYMQVTNLKSFFAPVAAEPNAQMVVGHAVITADYLKSFFAGFRKLFGGELGSFNPLLERARREAILRMMEEAARSRCNAVCNLRVEATNIYGIQNKKNNQMVAIAVLASGTAYRIETHSPRPMAS